MRKKVLYIDPWGVHNTADYALGMIQTLKTLVDLSVVENSKCVFPTEDGYNLYKWFFPLSQGITLKQLRKLVRGFEYILCWCRIFFLAKRKRYDVIHINWLLFYKIDIFFLRLLRPYCGRLVYTAHNVIPHNNGNRYIKDLKKIYGIVDNIVLHGESIKKEFSQFFPQYSSKIYIQYHGCNNCDLSDTITNQKILISDYEIDLSGYGKVLLFFGQLYWDKGIDRVIKCWIKQPKLADFSNNLLIVVGRKLDNNYLENLDVGMSSDRSFLYLPFYLADKELALLINACDCVLLPYRHASMSGVVFTSAYHKKTVLSTNVGSIPEYLVDGWDSFISENDDNELSRMIEKVLKTPKELLKMRGERLHNNFMQKYTWSRIVKKLVRDIYNC